MHGRFMTGTSVLPRAACVLAGALMMSPALAQTVTETESCEDLNSRFARQHDLKRGYACRLTGAAWDTAAGPYETRRAACDGETRRALARRVARRALDLETCLLQRLAAGNTRTPETRASSGPRDAGPNGRGAPRDAAGFRPAGTLADREPPTVPAPLTGQEIGPDNAATRAQSARRVRELLAQSPTPDRAGAARPTSVAREFRSGLAWSYGGTIEGMNCTKWEEPSDPHNWYDNYLCAVRDLGFKWSYRGPIQGRGLKCIQVNEPSDPDFWHDNYFCWPRDLNVTFRFSAAGRIPGLDCLAVVEPSDPHTWRDNFLCYREEAN
jgi:hypothetical protein